MMRHILGVLGVIAALVLLLVSMMMNYSFGYNLGKTHTDGQIYGMASAAADCLKALAPFFFFAALRNRVWSQAAAAALVWMVVTVYAFTSALGHAALNRFETSGNRVAANTSYKETQSEIKRLDDQLKWVPPHRPATTVAAELNVLKAQRAWMTTKECSDITLRASRDFCQQYNKLAAEHASGLAAEKLEAKLAELGAQTAKVSKAGGAAVLGMADPQANLIARLTGLDFDTVQTGLMLFVALLIEIGSGFGMYVAFSFWRPHQSLHSIGEPAAPTSKIAPPRPAAKDEKDEKAEAVERKDDTPPTGKADPIWTAEPTTAAAADGKGPPAVRPFGDNDNKSGDNKSGDNKGAPKPAIMPPDDVQRFYQDCVDGNVAQSSYVDATRLNEAYKIWCKKNGRRALAMPKFLAEFDKLKVEKHEIGGGVKYFGVALKADIERELDQKGSAKRGSGRTAMPQAAAPDAKTTAEPSAASDEASANAAQLRAAAGEMQASLGESPEVAPGKARAA